MFDAGWVDEVGRVLGQGRPDRATDDELLQAAVTLARLDALVAAAEAVVLAELEVRGVCDREHGLTTSTWLAREAMLPTSVARQRVRVAEKLRSSLPEIGEALADGRITWHHARVLAEACTPRVAEPLAEMQDELLDLAEAATFDRWRNEVRGIVALLDADGAFDPNEALARNRLRLSSTLDGALIVSGQLVGEHALGVREAIETRADELWRRFRDDHERCPDIAVPPAAALRALALADLLRAGQAVDVHSTRPPRPEVTLVVPAGEWGPGMVQPERDAGVVPLRPRRAVHDRDGTPLPDAAVSTLCCDADLMAVVVDSLGVPLDMGRHVRLATAAQRRAIAVRDGGCCFPGCDLPVRWADIHHIDPFRTGGRTDLARLAPLCRHHHGVTHRSGWQMSATDDGWFWWTTPSGQTFWSQRHGRRRRGPTPSRPAQAA